MALKLNRYICFCAWLFEDDLSIYLYWSVYKSIYRNFSGWFNLKLILNLIYKKKHELISWETEFSLEFYLSIISLFIDLSKYHWQFWIPCAKIYTESPEQQNFLSSTAYKNFHWRNRRLLTANIIFHCFSKRLLA